MGLPEVSSYSQVEIDEACRFSSALSTALKRIQSSDLSVQRRNQAWAEATLATIYNRASPEIICRSWSLAADEVLKTVAYELNAPEELALFAFGKLGSHELNLSSDVDIILVSEEDRPENIKFLRRFQSRLSGLGDDGFLFRLDFDLRPGGKLGPMIPTVDQFIDFYGNYGETWERLAFVRLRPILGSSKIISSLASFGQKFVFKKHLDFSLLEDLKALRAKVHEYNWQRSQEGNIDLKLGVGGIRDIELFTHALQVVHGGKDPRLRHRETTKSLELFFLHKILPEEDVLFLMGFYWQLRSLENLVQSENDHQTHILKKSLKIPAHLKKTHQDLASNMNRCDKIVSDLLGKISDGPQHIPSQLDQQVKWLVGLGFETNEIKSVWPEVFKMPVLSRNRERDLEIRNRFLFKFLTLLSEQGPTRNVLLTTKDFLSAVRAKASFFSMLNTNEALLEMLAQLFSHSPYLANMICSRPELIDSLVIRNIEEPAMGLQNTDEFLESLVERRMLTELVSGAEFLREESLEVIQDNLSDAADSICLRLLNGCAHEVGAPSPFILALGKWGGRELGFGSDLDCIFVTENAPTENDHKIVRRFVHRLTQSHRGGSLYAIDTRLKMTGAGGVLITSYNDLADYLSSRAEVWERQAYLRGRWLGPCPLPALTKNCLQQKVSTTEIIELEKIRLRLMEVSKGSLDLKYAEGGLIDLEFASQVAVLKNQIQTQGTSTQSFVKSLAQSDSAWKLHENELLRNYDLLRLAEQYQKLIRSENTSVLSTDPIYVHPIANRLKLEASQFMTRIEETLSSQVAILKKLDPRRSQSY